MVFYKVRASCNLYTRWKDFYSEKVVRLEVFH